MEINWSIDDNGDLVITMPNPLDRAKLLAELYPEEDPDMIYNFPQELRNDFHIARLALSKPRGWGEIEESLYQILAEVDGYELWYNQPFVALWGGPVIALVDYPDDGNRRMIKGWTDEHYVHYDSESGIDTLAKTGRCVWRKIVFEDEDEIVNEEGQS